jgi:hypothetical protein
MGPAWIFNISNLACSFGKSISENKKLFQLLFFFFLNKVDVRGCIKSKTNRQRKMNR